MKLPHWIILGALIVQVIFLTMTAITLMIGRPFP